MSNLNKEETAMETLINYYKDTECEKCMFYFTDTECGIHNPSNWKGVKKMSEDERIEQLELENKVLQENNKGLKAKIDELQEENKKLKIDNQILKETLYGGNVSE